MHDTFPNRLAAERLFDRHQLDKRNRAAVLRFNGLFQFVCVNVCHRHQLYTVSIRSTERITDTHRDTIMRLMVEVGNGCAALANEQMRELPYRRRAGHERDHAAHSQVEDLRLALARALRRGRSRWPSARQDAALAHQAARTSLAERVVALTLTDAPVEATHWTGAMMAKAAGISVSPSPRAAARTAKGRTKVVDWIKMLENHASKLASQPVWSPPLFAWGPSKSPRFRAIQGYGSVSASRIGTESVVPAEVVPTHAFRFGTHREFGATIGTRKVENAYSGCDPSSARRSRG